MRAIEVVRGGTEAVTFRRLRNGSPPSRGERGVELVGAAMDLAGALRSAQEPPRCLVGTMAPVQHPGDAEVIRMAHPAGKHGPRLPGVRQLVVAHGESVSGRPNPVRPVMVV